MPARKKQTAAYSYYYRFAIQRYAAFKSYRTLKCYLLEQPIHEIKRITSPTQSDYNVEHWYIVYSNDGCPTPSPTRPYPSPPVPLIPLPLTLSERSMEMLQYVIDGLHFCLLLLGFT